ERIGIEIVPFDQIARRGADDGDDTAPAVGGGGRSRDRDGFSGDAHGFLPGSHPSKDVRHDPLGTSRLAAPGHGAYSVLQAAAVRLCSRSSKPAGGSETGGPDLRSRMQTAAGSGAHRSVQ